MDVPFYEAEEYCSDLNGTLMHENQTNDVRVTSLIYIFTIANLQVQTYIGASVNPSKPNTKYQWWFHAVDGGCKTLSSEGEIEEHTCESTIEDDSIIRKPICQLGN